MTIHKAQGLTCDTALVYATDDLYRELGYVALSRGRDLNVIYTTGDVQIDNEAHIQTPARVPSEMLMSGLTISRAQELAIDVAERGAEIPIERLSTPALVANDDGSKACSTLRHRFYRGCLDTRSSTPNGTSP